MGNYIKHGTGPNDWKKGNRTRGKDRPNRKGGGYNEPAAIALKAAKEAEHAEIEKYKQIAESKAKGNRYGQEYALELLNRLTDHIEEQRANRQPVTIGGLIAASGMNHDTWYRYKNGDADYMLYRYMDDHGIDFDQEGTIQVVDGSEVLLVRLSDVCKNALNVVQQQLESNCYTNKGNPAGSIFGLKAAFGWQDQPKEHKTTNNNTLVLNNVATLEEAKEALRLLSE